MFLPIQQRGNLFSLLSGDDKTMERVTMARSTVSKIPSEFIYAISGTKLEKRFSLSVILCLVL